MEKNNTLTAEDSFVKKRKINFLAALQRQLKLWYDQIDSLEKEIRVCSIEGSSILDEEDPFEPIIESSQNLLESQKLIFKDQRYLFDEIKKNGNKDINQLLNLSNQLKNMNAFKKYEENDNLLKKDLWSCQELNVILFLVFKIH
jgi:glutaredoxin-related protein